MVVPTLRLMADYECYPLWGSEGGLRNLNPLDLPITGDLATALTEWADEYTATMERTNPRISGFLDVAAAEAWLSAGAELANRLRQQGVDVDYIHDGQSAADLVAVQP